MSSIDRAWRSLGHFHLTSAHRNDDGHNNTWTQDMWEFLQAEIKAHPVYGRLPVFVLGESMGGNVAIQLGLKDADEGQGLLHGAILLAPMVTIKDSMKPPQVLIDLLKKASVCADRGRGHSIPNEHTRVDGGMTNDINPNPPIPKTNQVAPLFPTLPVSPTPDVLDRAFRRREVLELARKNPYSYTLKPRLGTALQLLEATDYVTRWVGRSVVCRGVGVGGKGCF